MSFQKILHKVVSGKDLTEDEMMAAMTEIMEGNVVDSQFAAFLTALQLKHETVPEIVGAARVMRAKAEKVKVNASHKLSIPVERVAMVPTPLIFQRRFLLSLQELI